MPGVGGYTEPEPLRHDPEGMIRAGDSAIKIEGELVPVVDVELGGRESVYINLG